MTRSSAPSGRTEEQRNSVAPLHLTIGKTYWDLGLLDPVERHLAAAAELFERAAGPDDVATLAAKAELGGLYVVRARHDEAVPLLEEVLATARRALGDRHVTTARILTELGHVAFDSGAYERAVKLHAEALAVYEAVSGPEHGDTGLSMSNLAICYRHLGRLDEAEQLYGAALSKAYEQRNQIRILRNLRRKAKALGYELVQPATGLISSSDGHLA